MSKFSSLTRSKLVSSLSGLTLEQAHSIADTAGIRGAFEDDLVTVNVRGREVEGIATIRDDDGNVVEWVAVGTMRAWLVRIAAGEAAADVLAEGHKGRRAMIRRDVVKIRL